MFSPEKRKHSSTQKVQIPWLIPHRLALREAWNVDPDCPRGPWLLHGLRAPLGKLDSAREARARELPAGMTTKQLFPKWCFSLAFLARGNQPLNLMVLIWWWWYNWLTEPWGILFYFQSLSYPVALGWFHHFMITFSYKLRCRTVQCLQLNQTSIFPFLTYSLDAPLFAWERGIPSPVS